MFVRRFDVVAFFAVLLWMLTLILTPLINQWGGEKALHFMIYLGVIMQAMAVLTVLGRGNGWRPAMLSVFPILPLAWLVEFMGSQTGFPFGRYHYTELLQPQVGGVPLLIPLAWLMMLPPAWAIAARIAYRGMRGLSLRLTRALVAALAFTAWDLFLDPQMVAWGFWVWRQPGAYFGIPLVNFLGWFLASFFFSFLLMPSSFSPLASNFLLLIYALTWFLQTFAQLFFWNLPGPALVGFLGMGGMFLWAFLTSRYATNGP
ncbi:MAG: carotenoid biosynthesis protein [Anaerolineales bacterium]|nr:carotenoid biosynthesis protein [Anaerolineales bacterium]